MSSCFLSIKADHLAPRNPSLPSTSRDKTVGTISFSDMFGFATSVSPPSGEPRYRAIFKERSSYLFVGWATTLLTIGYLWSHDDLEVYGGIMMISNMLVALSFLAWLWLSYTYEKANENPTASTSIRFLLLCCYGIAIEAVSMTYMAEYFLARHPIYSASSLCLLIVGGICYLEAHYMLNPSVIT
ncbi:hypothetical protein HanRHA438_Chr05g0245591 [Helianthus annuus]|nr:hypothetical protein HanRHA438_Chr05g0245591 [Helianthus annuus]